LTLKYSLSLLLPLVLLAGCNKSAENDRRSATGEVLKGTISDDMLPLDKLKSQGPLLTPSEKKGTPDGAADETSGAADVAEQTSGEPEAGATTAPEPAASAAP
jgi:hypothetical protein